MIRSSHRSCSVRRGVLRNFAKFTRKHMCQAPFFKKCCRQKTCNFIKKRLRHMCFPLNFAKFLRTPFSQNTSGQLFLCDLLLLLSSFIKTLTVTYHVYTRYKLNLIKQWYVTLWAFLLKQELASRNIVQSLEAHAERAIFVKSSILAVWQSSRYIYKVTAKQWNLSFFDDRQDVQSLTHSKPILNFYTHWKHQKTKDFLTFSGGIEMEHWFPLVKT